MNVSRSAWQLDRIGLRAELRGSVLVVPSRQLSALYSGLTAEQLREARVVVLDELGHAVLAGADPETVRQHAVLAERIAERARRLDTDRLARRQRLAAERRRTATA